MAAAAEAAAEVRARVARTCVRSARKVFRSKAGHQVSDTARNVASFGVGGVLLRAASVVGATWAAGCPALRGSRARVRRIPRDHDLCDLDCLRAPERIRTAARRRGPKSTRAVVLDFAQGEQPDHAIRNKPDAYDWHRENGILLYFIGHL